MLIGAIALWGAAAQAQTAPAAQGAAPAAETVPPANEIVVTGTLFRTKVETAAPVTVLSAQTIQKQGIVTVSDAIRSISADNSGTLPPAFPGAFAFGATGVALRGLTVNSTLVLTDGLRNADYPIGDDGVRDFVDLNTLPLAIVDHVDIQKDGASYLYGADAIGGVVNLILKPTFQGAEGTVEGGWTERGGDNNEHIDLTLGKGDLDTDKYNFYISGEYQHDDAIKAIDRPFPFNTTNLTSIGGGNPSNGQPQLFSGSIYGSVQPATMLTPGDITTGTPVLNPATANAQNPNGLPYPTQILAPGGCGPKGKTSVDNLGNNYCAQNLDAGLFDYPRETRAGIYGRFTVQLNPQTTGYISLSYFQNSVYQPQTPPQIQNSTPNNTNTIVLPAVLSNGQLNPNDPYANIIDPATGQRESALINYAFGGVPSSFSTTDHAYRFVGDLKGLWQGWNWEAGLAAEHEDLDYAQTGFLNYPNLLAAINNGTYNFINPGANSAAVINAIDPIVRKTSTSDLVSIDLTATHPILDLTGGPLNFGAGVHAQMEDQVNPELNPNGIYEGLGVDHASGHRDVASVFFEFDAPVFKQLDLNVAGRYDHYSDFGDAFSPKATVKWTPIKEFALRATYSQGFRAPSFAESHTAAVGGFVNFQPSQSAAAYYAAHGGDGYVQQYPLEEVSIANPNIKPERSKSFTVGTVFQPVSFLSATIDYYYIQKEDLIAPGSQGPALNAYFAGQALPAGDTIVADKPDPNAPGPGNPAYVAGLSNLARPLVVGTEYTNANSLITTGFDVEVRGRYSLPWDVKLTTDFNFTDILTFRYSTPGLPTYDYVGTESPYNLSSGAGTPKYKINASTTLTKDRVSFTTTVNWVSGMLENAEDLGFATCISNLTGDCKVKGFASVDTNLDVKVNDKIDLFLNAYNLFDALPSIDQINYGGINYNPTYQEAGIIGRAFKVGMHFKY